MACLFFLALGAGVTCANAPAVGEAEASGCPLVSNRGSELIEDARVWGRGRGLGACLCGAGGLDVEKVLLDLGELVCCDGREGGIGGNEGVENCLLMRHRRRHVVEMAFKLGERWELGGGGSSGKTTEIIEIVTGAGPKPDKPEAYDARSVDLNLRFQTP